MGKKTTAGNVDSLDIYKKICKLVYFFIFTKAKWIFPEGIGISRSQQAVQYSSAQHDTLEVDYYSFWYTTELGEKKQFLHCSHGINNISINGVSAEENPDNHTLNRLSRASSMSKAEFIYKLLEKMFVFANHGLTVDQYIKNTESVNV